MNSYCEYIKNWLCSLDVMTASRWELYLACINRHPTVRFYSFGSYMLLRELLAELVEKLGFEHFRGDFVGCFKKKQIFR